MLHLTRYETIIKKMALVSGHIVVSDILTSHTFWSYVIMWSLGLKAR